MNTAVFKFIILYSISLLLALSSKGQGPGAFNVTNNTNCDITAQAWAYNGSCGSVDCESGVQGTTGQVSVPANSTVNIATGYSGGGDVWAEVETSISGSQVSKDADASCSFPVGGTTCSFGVSFYSCNVANLP